MRRSIVGIFSYFKKKDQSSSRPEDRDAPSRKRRGSADHGISGNTLGPLADPTTIHRDMGRTTALKIDAIESEMMLEFITTTQIGNPVTLPAAEIADMGAAPLADISPDPIISPPLEPEPVVPLLDLPLAVPAAAENATTAPANLAAAAVLLATTPAIEEAAILFASRQSAVAEQILREAIQEQDPLDKAAQLAWSMLFDLYQLTGQAEQFDALALAYADKFQSSPPAWPEGPRLDAPNPASSKPPATPSVAFSGMLDAQIAKQLTRAQKLAESHSTLRLEFSRVTSVDPVGCGLLLRVLKKLQKAGLELVLVGAPELAHKIRSILAVGRRDETEAPWLLLLEILQLLNREQEFEESSIDYCITFEVSPPAFAAPQTHVRTAPEEPPAAATVLGAFSMPLLIEGDITPLTQAIHAYAAGRDPVLLDCSQLARIDFTAASELLNALATLAGKSIELHNVNHLIVALLQTLGMPQGARVIPRKN
jgi:ABC-type transporter Mla MlaB component